MAEQQKDDATKSEQDLKRKAYQNAESRLRAAHQAEFEAFREEECAALGVPYTRRLSARERAAVQMKALLAEYPDIAADLK